MELKSILNQTKSKRINYFVVMVLWVITQVFGMILIILSFVYFSVEKIIVILGCLFYGFFSFLCFCPKRYMPGIKFWNQKFHFFLTGITFATSFCFLMQGLHLGIYPAFIWCYSTLMFIMSVLLGLRSELFDEEKIEDRGEEKKENKVEEVEKVGQVGQVGQVEEVEEVSEMSEM